MKKIFILLIMLFIFTGCSLLPTNLGSEVENKEVTTSYGSYTIPDDWTKNDYHSTKDKYFYTNKRDIKNNMPNNISVEMGKNRYLEKDHILFRQAITRQLAAQSKSMGVDNLNGSGSSSKNGYIVYTFTMKTNDSTTIQHYIVGDYKYVLIHETIFDYNYEKEVKDAGKYIVDTFKWNEE